MRHGTAEHAGELIAGLRDGIELTSSSFDNDGLNIGGSSGFAVPGGFPCLRLGTCILVGNSGNGGVNVGVIPLDSVPGDLSVLRPGS